MADTRSAANRSRPTEIPAAASPPAMPTLAVALVVVAALYFGREIFVPLALAVLLSFALAPPMQWLRRLHIGRIPAVLIVVVLAFTAIFTFGTVVAGQVASLANNLPEYQRNIQTKIRSLRDAVPDTGLVERASTMLQELGDQIATPEADPAGGSGTDAPSASGVVSDLPAPPEPQPIPVEIKRPDPAPLQIIQSIVGPLLGPLATTGVVIVFVIFILLQREDLRDRLIRLAGTGDLQRTTTALDDAGHRVSRYLLMQLVVNATYGLPVGLGLWLIGVPNPVLWGLLAVILRFVPYVGPFVAAAFPLALSVAVDPGWTMLLWTAALFITLELISNNIVEPWLYGASTGLSPVAIILAAVFWTWLWGPIGLLLSTPLTVCLGVLGRHIPRMQFLDVLLGSEPVLAPEEHFYQRMLAGDPDEITEQAETFLKDKPLVAFYDTVALRALALAEYDRARGALDSERRGLVLESVAGVVDNLSDAEDGAPAPEDAAGQESEATALSRPAPRDLALPPDWSDKPALCVSGRGDIDEAAALLLAQLLDRSGVGARVVPCEVIAPQNVARLDVGGVQVICLSYMNSDSFAHARYLVRRLRRRLPHTKIVAGFWTLSPEEAARRDPAVATGADFVVMSLGQAVDRVLDITEAAAHARAAE